MKESKYLRDNQEMVEKLKQLPSLRNFDDEILHGVLELSKIRTYEPGECILEEGSFDSWIYFLVSGKVKIVKNEEDLSILQRCGDVFGEMGIIDGSARSASVIATEKTVCLATDASFVERLEGSKKIAFSYLLYRLFAEGLASRLRTTTDDLIQVKAELSQLKGQKSE